MDTAINGFTNTINFIQFRREEDTVRAGANAFSASILQAIAIPYALKAISTFEPAGKVLNKVFFLGYNVTALPIIGVALAINAKFISRSCNDLTEVYHKNNQNSEEAPFIIRAIDATGNTFKAIDNKIEKHFWLRKTVYLIHNNIGAIAQIGLIAATVGLCSTGGLIAGTGMLVLVMGDLLCQKGILPYSVRSKFYPVIQIASIISQLAVGGIFGKAYAVAQIAYVVKKKIDAYKNPPVETPPIEGQKVKFTPISSNDINVSSNHIQKAKIKPEPKIDLKSEVDTLYKSISLEKKIIMGKAKSDEKLVKEIAEGNVSEDYESIKEYIESGLDKFVNSIEKRRILSGEPKSEKYYQALCAMAKNVIDSLKEKDEITRHDTLVALGLAGHYCGAGFFREITAQYQALVDFDAETLQGKILTILRQKREAIFQDIILGMLKQKRINKVLVDEEDIHIYNQFIKLFGKDLGLLSEIGAEADHGVSDSPANELLQLVFTKIITTVYKNQLPPELKNKSNADYSILMRESFDIEYDDSVIRDCINEEIKNAQVITCDNLRDWYIDWISDRENISREKAKSKFLEKVYQEEYDDENYRFTFEIRSSYLNAMLVEMGIFELPEDSKDLLPNEEVENKE